MRYRRVGCLNCCGDCHAVVVVINASRRAMAAYMDFTTPRCDRRRYSCEAARLLSRSAAAQLKCIAPRAMYSCQATNRTLRELDSTNAGLRRDCGVESNTRASPISIYEIGDCYVSTSCNTRATTNDSEKGWNRSCHQLSVLPTLANSISRRAMTESELHRARFARRATVTCCKHS